MNLQMGAATELSAEEFFDSHYIQTLAGFDPHTIKSEDPSHPQGDPLRRVVPLTGDGTVKDMYPGWHKKGTHYMKENHQFKFGARGDKEKVEM